jgi:hypothetical protein
MCLWQDEYAVKVLRWCKVVPAREAGGKVIIFDAVVESRGSQNVLRETQALFDIQMMRVHGGEGEEHQWRKIFLDAGFRDYKIAPMLGSDRSLKSTHECIF